MGLENIDDEVKQEGSMPVSPIYGEEFVHYGMTQRMWIATHLMAGMLASGGGFIDVLAETAVDSADALIKELSK